MSLLGIEGFAWCSNGTTGQTELSAEGFTIVSGATSGPQSSITRFGAGKSYGLLDTDPDGSFGKTLDSALGTLFVGFAGRMPTIGTARWLLCFRDGSTEHVSLALNTSGQLEVRRGATSATTGTLLGTSSSTFTAGTWYYIELKVLIHDSTGTVDLHVNGSSEIALTGQDTRNGGNATVDRWYFPGGSQFYIQDLYWADTAGSSPNNTFQGDCQVEYVTATADGTHTDWTANTGARYQAVDDATPDDDGTYVQTSTVDHLGTFAIGDASAGGTIRGVKVSLRVKKTAAGSCTVAPVIRISGTDYAGTAQNVNSGTYSHVSQMYDQDPTAAAWEASVFNAMEVGIKRVS